MFNVSDLQVLIESNRELAGPILALFAFGESLVLVGLFMPATALMIATGILIQKGVLDFWTVMYWSVIGAVLGDAVTYWIGRAVGPSLSRRWPLNRDPTAIAKARLFFRKYGFISIFLGRFLGPIRSTIPAVAGMAKMHHTTFQIANVVSAIVWVPVLLLPGHILGTRVSDIDKIGWGETVFVLIFILLLTFAFSWIGIRMQQRKAKDRRNRRPPAARNSNSAISPEKHEWPRRP